MPRARAIARPARPRAGRPRRRAAATWPGRRVVVRAGGTREPLDPVRFLGNRSLRQAGLRPRRGRRGRAAPRSPGGGQRRRCRRPTACTSCRSRPPWSCRRRSTEAADDADVVVMAAAVGRLPARRATPSTKIKKTHDDPDADASAPTIELVRNPDVLAGLVAARGERHGSPVIVGFAAETGDAEGTRAGPRPRQAGPQGLRPAGRQRGRASTRPSARTRTRVHILRRGLRRRDRRRARPPRTTSRPRCGTPSQAVLARLADRTTRPARPSVSSRCHRRSTARVRTPVHVRVRHRGTPRQDLRPDQRRDPRRHARAGPAQPRRRRDDGDHRPGARRRRGHHRGLRRDPARSCARPSLEHRLRLARPRASTARSCGVSISIGQQSPTSPRASTPPTRTAPAASTRSTSRAPATRA